MLTNELSGTVTTENLRHNVKDQPSIRIGCIALLGSFLVFIVSENLRAKNPLPVTLSCSHILFTGAGIAYF